MDLDDLLHDGGNNEEGGNAKAGAVKAKPPAPTPIVAPTPPKRSPAITCMVSHGGRLFAALADGRLLVSDMRRPTDRWEEVRFDG